MSVSYCRSCAVVVSWKPFDSQNLALGILENYCRVGHVCLPVFSSLCTGIDMFGGLDGAMRRLAGFRGFVCSIFRGPFALSGRLRDSLFQPRGSTPLLDFFQSIHTIMFRLLILFDSSLT